jgi:hypothetical protein
MSAVQRRRVAALTAALLLFGVGLMLGSRGAPRLSQGGVLSTAGTHQVQLLAGVRSSAVGEKAAHFTDGAILATVLVAGCGLVCWRRAVGGRTAAIVPVAEAHPARGPPNRV